MPPIASRASRIVKVLPGQRDAQVAGGADAGEAGADDQDVHVLRTGRESRTVTVTGTLSTLC